MLKRFARYPLTFGPTPVEKLDRLGKHLGGKVEIYAKREDCNSGLAFGGNKLRKLEYIIPDAIASDADTLVTIGGVQSNHTRMVAAVAAKVGMKCLLVQGSWVPHDDAVYDRVGNILLSRIMGAEVRLVDEGFDIGISQSWKKALYDVKAGGGRPYAIPAGASVHKYGGLGYVGFAEEVRAQEKQLGFAFDDLILASASTGMVGPMRRSVLDGRAGLTEFSRKQMRHLPDAVVSAFTRKPYTRSRLA
ncbi:1-aminocyclopropane-1-carboxylate deaminase (fragment) [Mesorhizobium metallidurans STM 2683]|uniref:1-aminocyclopropane-1-carboxylate deaminase n=1 Tax=Mesorhizobium metallidurans STM 2683 TaxID=1297569 RepID=M5EZ02_9HYPH